MVLRSLPVLAQNGLHGLPTHVGYHVRTPLPRTHPLYRLHISQPGQPDIELTIDEPCITFGRSADCDVVINQPYVSKRHAKLFNGAVIVDLGSSNGTFLDGERVDSDFIYDRELTLGHEDVVVEVVPLTTSDDSEAATQVGFDKSAELKKRVRQLEKELRTSKEKIALREKELVELREKAATDSSATVALPSQLLELTREVLDLKSENLDMKRQLLDQASGLSGESTLRPPVPGETNDTLRREQS